MMTSHACRPMLRRQMRVIMFRPPSSRCSVRLSFRHPGQRPDAKEFSPDGRRGTGCTRGPPRSPQPRAFLLRWTRPSLQTLVRSLCRGSGRALTHPTFLLALQQPFRKIRWVGALCAGVKATESEWFGRARARRPREGACHKVTSSVLETCQFVRRSGRMRPLPLALPGIRRRVRASPRPGFRSAPGCGVQAGCGLRVGPRRPVEGRAGDRTLRDRCSVATSGRGFARTRHVVRTRYSEACH